MLRVVCFCTDQPCRAVPAPPVWQKCPAVLVLLESLWSCFQWQPAGQGAALCQGCWHSPALCTQECAIFYLGCFLAPDRCSFHFSTFNLSHALCVVFAHTASPWWCTLSILLFIILNPFQKAQPTLHPEGWFTICSKWKTSG